MYSRGIRGAITIEKNDEQSIKEATIELIDKIQAINEIDASSISHVIFTLTPDINMQFPAKFAREYFTSWKYVPMMCYNELDVPNAIKKCLRILIIVNTDKKQDEIQHIYLKGATVLRKDILSK